MNQIRIDVVSGLLVQVLDNLVAYRFAVLVIAVVLWHGLDEGD